MRKRINSRACNMSHEQLQNYSDTHAELLLVCILISLLKNAKVSTDSKSLPPLQCCFSLHTALMETEIAKVPARPFQLYQQGCLNNFALRQT